MLKKTLVSPLALAFGLALTGAVAAQNMIGDQDVSDADWSAVQEYCDTLAADEAVEGDVTTGPEETENDDDSGTDYPVTTGDVDFMAITLDDCREAGLIE
jgi:hypothetical protein